MSANCYAAQLKANGFSKSFASLDRQGFQSFMPLRRTTVRHARQVRETLKPIFPGYLFNCFGESHSDWRKVNAKTCVSKLISFAQNLLAPVPQELIDSLRLHCDQKNILLPLTDLAAGVRVKVLSGAFSEFNGQVETLLQGDMPSCYWSLWGKLRALIYRKLSLKGLRFETFS